MSEAGAPDAAYNVTLHPFDEGEYTSLLIPVVLGQRPNRDLTSRYGIDPEAMRLIHAWVPRMRDALTALRGDGVPWSMVINFAAAAMSANLRPAYHLGDLGLSYWRAVGDCPFRTYTKSTAILAAKVPALGVAISEIREGFVGPCSAGSYIASGDVVTLIRELEHRPWQFVEQELLRAVGYEPESVLHVVLEVLHFARERRLGMIRGRPLRLARPQPRALSARAPSRGVGEQPQPRRRPAGARALRATAVVRDGRTARRALTAHRAASAIGFSRGSWRGRRGQGCRCPQ